MEPLWPLEPDTPPPGLDAKPGLSPPISYEELSHLIRLDGYATKASIIAQDTEADRHTKESQLIVGRGLLRSLDATLKELEKKPAWNSGRLQRLRRDRAKLSKKYETAIADATRARKDLRKASAAAARAESRFQRKRNKLEDKLLRAIASGKAFPLETSLATLLVGVQADMRLVAMSTRRHILAGHDATRLLDPRSCVGSYIGDRVLLRIFYALVMEEPNNVARHAYSAHRHLACASLTHFEELEHALSIALNKFDVRWARHREIHLRALEIFTQANIQFLDFSNRFGRVPSFVWFQKHRNRLVDRLLHGKATYLSSQGLFIHNNESGQIDRILPGCTASALKVSRTSIHWNVDKERHGCGGMIDLIDSIANPLAWGIGGCTSHDLLAGGPTGGNAAQQAKARLRLKSSWVSNGKLRGLGALAPSYTPPTGVHIWDSPSQPPVFSCNHGCTQDKHGRRSGVTTSGFNATGYAANFLNGSLFSEPFRNDPSVRFAQQREMTPFGTTLSDFGAMCAFQQPENAGLGGLKTGPNAIGCSPRIAPNNIAENFFSNCARTRLKVSSQKYRETWEKKSMLGRSRCGLVTTDDKPSSSADDDGLIFPDERTKEQKQIIARTTRNARDWATSDRQSMGWILKTEHAQYDSKGNKRHLTLTAEDTKAALDAAQNMYIATPKEWKSLIGGRKNADAATTTAGGKPIIVISQDTLEKASQEQLDALIRHEVAHATLYNAIIRAANADFSYTEDQQHHIMKKAGLPRENIPDHGMRKCIDGPCPGCSFEDHRNQEVEKACGLRAYKEATSPRPLPIECLYAKTTPDDERCIATTPDVTGMQCQDARPSKGQELCNLICKFADDMNCSCDPTLYQREPWPHPGVLDCRYVLCPDSDPDCCEASPGGKTSLSYGMQCTEGRIHCANGTCSCAMANTSPRLERLIGQQKRIPGLSRREKQRRSRPAKNKTRTKIR
ncbi:MAG: hypothetical protein B7733_18735 [Myxococcales bacterium FL481]|nr:MAG: hypothetical protein B7733_18735 [Myxococcales bacterium FL481]